jgi:hypothetical protein
MVLAELTGITVVVSDPGVSWFIPAYKKWSQTSLFSPKDGKIPDPSKILRYLCS